MVSIKIQKPYEYEVYDSACNTLFENVDNFNYHVQKFYDTLKDSGLQCAVTEVERNTLMVDPEDPSKFCVKVYWKFIAKDDSLLSMMIDSKKTMLSEFVCRASTESDSFHKILAMYNLGTRK